MRTTHVILLILALAFVASESRAQFALLSNMENDHDAAPGGSYSGTLRVRNTADVPREVTVYQKDSSYGLSGAAYADPGTLRRSNAEWISFAPSTFTIAPQEDYTLSYTISVPDGDTLRGSYWSVLMLESVISEPQAAKSSGDSPQIRLGVRFRYAVQIAAHVGGGAFEVAMSDFKAEAAEGGGSILQVDLRNEGDLMVDPEVWVELYDTEGSLIGRFDGVRKRLYPGSARRQQIALGDLEAGEYKALVLVDAGEDELFGAQYTLNF